MEDKEYIQHLKKDDLTINECIKILDEILSITDGYYYHITELEVKAIKRKLKKGYWR